MDKREKTILGIAAGALILLVIIVAVCSVRSAASRGYTPPAFEPNARQDIPESIGQGGVLELPIQGQICRIAMNPAPAATEGNLEIHLASHPENTVWIRLVLLDETGATAAETGILRPGEYLETIPCKAASGDQFTAKLLTYAPETYYSMGTAAAGIAVP